MDHTADSGAPPPHYRWNFAALTGDASAWFFAMAFMDVLTVLPLFFQRSAQILSAQAGSLPVYLSASFLTGMMISIRSAGWLVPQFFSARVVAALPRKKPALLKACWIGRLPLFAAAGYLLSASARSHVLAAILIVLVAWIFFSFGEGFASVPWTYIVSRTIPARRRGRLFGGMQVIGGALAAGSGVLVRHLLVAGAPAFPRSFGILFALSFLLLLLSLGFIHMIREPVGSEEPISAAPFKEYLHSIPELVRGERAFHRMVIVQLMGSAAGLAAPLYTLYAVDQMHIPAIMIGRYLSVGMTGAVLGSIAWAALNDRFGPRSVIRVNLAASIAAPCAALASGILLKHSLISHASAEACYGASYFLIGATFNGSFTGYTNYMLENTPDSHRAEYVGLMNTLNAPAILMPVIGTAIAGAVSPELGFGFAGLGCALAIAVSATLPRDPVHSPARSR